MAWRGDVERKNIGDSYVKREKQRWEESHGESGPTETKEHDNDVVPVKISSLSEETRGMERKPTKNKGGGKKA